MKIPYGRSHFGDIRRGGFFYVDKTPFIPVLESAELGYAYLVLLRPRRMGKSLLLSMLEHYYDIGRKEQFDELFRGLWVHEHPTPERSSYLVLSLDFSTVVVDDGRDSLRESFAAAVRGRIFDFLLAYTPRIPELGWLKDRFDEYQEPVALLGMLLSIVHATGHRLYVFIDEYDTFTNSILSAGQQQLYEDIVERTGFIRTFYRALKAGTQSGAIGRIFITGVSPILLDDLSSGFNIATHISQHPDLNTLVGFTRADVELALDTLLVARADLAGLPGIGDRAALLAVLELYYNGYRFSTDAKERVFNSDMVLYFLRELATWRRYPDQMLDHNVRTDYGRLQRLASLTGASASLHRALLEGILSEGHVLGSLTEQFGAKSLSSRQQLLSLLYYMGMLTLAPQPPGAAGLRLEIPNRVIRELQWEHLARLLREQEGLELDQEDLEAALRRMAVDGEIEAFLGLFHERVVKAMGLKDLRQLSEKSMKLMLLAFISLSRLFHPLSEKEFAQGYCDLFLGVSPRVAAARYAWLLEIKYLPTDAGERAIEDAFAQAAAQVARYAGDARLVPLLTQGRELRCGALVFVGAREVLFRAQSSAGGA